MTVIRTITLTIALACASAAQAGVAYVSTQPDTAVEADTVPRKIPFYERGFIGKVYHYVTSANRVERKRNLDISFIGGPGYSTEEGFGIGIVGSGRYSAGGLRDTVTPLSNITLTFQATTGLLFKLRAEGYHILVKDKYRANYDAYFFTFPDRWWGIGYANNSNNANDCAYKHLQGFATVDFVRQLRPGLFVGPRVLFTGIHAYDMALPQLLQGESPTIFTLGGGVTALYDTRDIPLAPTRGLYVRADGLFHPRLVNKRPFTMAELTVSAYREWWRGGVIAASWHTRLTWGDTPWSMLSTFGGPRRMRGYWDGRYRDKMESDAVVELRQRVWGRHGVALWGAAGNVFRSFDTFRWRQTLPNWGVGYRWEFKKGVNVRLDAGFGRGQYSVNFSLNEAF